MHINLMMVLGFSWRIDTNTLHYYKIQNLLASEDGKLQNLHKELSGQYAWSELHWSNYEAQLVWKFLQIN